MRLLHVPGLSLDRVFLFRLNRTTQSNDQLGDFGLKVNPTIIYSLEINLLAHKDFSHVRVLSMIRVVRNVNPCGLRFGYANDLKLNPEKAKNLTTPIVPLNWACHEIRRRHFQLSIQDYIDCSMDTAFDL